jgi:hypothetical protein
MNCDVICIEKSPGKDSSWVRKSDRGEGCLMRMDGGVLEFDGKLSVLCWWESGGCLQPNCVS